MSRIGLRAIEVPSGVTVAEKNGAVFVKGPKGELSERLPAGISMQLEGSQLNFTRTNELNETRALHGLIRALTANMVTGVTKGFRKDLEIQGVGYRAQVAGKQLNMTLGFSHPVEVPIPASISVSVENNTLIKIESISRAALGQFAADIRALRPPEPYKGKGVRYVGEHVRRKVGKSGTA